MDILAPVFAYLTCVAGIIGAFVVSFYLVLSPPAQPDSAPRIAAVESMSATKGDLLAKKPILHGATAEAALNHAAPALTTQKREETRHRVARAVPAEAPASPVASPKLAAGDPRAKGKITRAQWRELVQQERNRRLAYQQNADFDSRFLGYAD